MNVLSKPRGRLLKEKCAHHHVCTISVLFFYQKGKIVSVNLSLNVFKSVLGSLLAHFLTVFKCDHGLEASPFNF